MSNITYATIATSISEYTGMNKQAITAWLRNDSSAGYDLKSITDEIHAGQSIANDEDALVVLNERGVVTDEMLSWLAE